MRYEISNFSYPIWNSIGIVHAFISIVMIALLATIGGAKGWSDIETYGVSHEVWRSQFLALPFGIPSAEF